MANSAFVGEPPATEDDFYIVRGILRTYGLNNLNASAGLVFSIQRPENSPDESKKPAILAGMILVILAIVIPTVVRVIIRLKGARTQFGADDLAIIAAASLAVSYPCIVIAMLAQTAAGRHTYESTYEEYNLYFYYLSVCRIIFYVSVGLIKVSITLFVRRLADRASKKWRLFADIFLGTVVIYILLSIFLCVDTGLQNKFLSSMHVAQSIVLLLAPIIILWYVKINTAKKARLFFIWLVGGTTVLGGLLQQTMVTITNDSCWQFTSAMRWTVLDLTFGTLTASLPVLDAAIMGTWSSIKTKIGTSGSHSRSRTQGWTDLEHDTRNTTTVRRATAGDSDSIENIISGNKGGVVEMGILRTDEVELTYDSDPGMKNYHGK
ncbi:integral membrane protein [Fusarium pseudocircinatum]|uniref:Integral membrane protein n=1 Tax=Fusarium pseudocircinatum TaxID=56676 RepID=A0A8H5UTZ9_9HYPO|nr:integral membrane protein [Fusarium pseudocircinatum]